MIIDYHVDRETTMNDVSSESVITYLVTGDSRNFLYVDIRHINSSLLHRTVIAGQLVHTVGNQVTIYQIKE